MNNALAILTELDGHLDQRIDLTLYGRAAIQLGYPSPPTDTLSSMDVDIILWTQQAEILHNTTGFWSAIERTNHNLSKSGLYVSHLFGEDQVILRPCWKEERRAIISPLRHIELFRLHDLDLLLSKLMRDDPQDFQDAQFIVSAGQITAKQIEQALHEARIPDIPEIREEFEKASVRLLKALI